MADRLTVGVAARLSRYLQVLTQARKMGKDRISSQEISDYTTASIRNAGQVPENIAIRYAAEASQYGDMWRKLLQDAEVWVLRIQHRRARRTGNRLRELARAQLDRRAAIGAVQPFDLRRYHPAISRRFVSCS